VLQGEAQKGENNLFRKLVWVILVAILAVPSELPKFWNVDAVEATETVATADAFACPNPGAMFSYFNKGIGNETADCSAIVFSDLVSPQSFGQYPMTYFDWASIDGELTGPPEVEIFRGGYRGLELYVIIDYVDEHALEEAPGLRGSVVYTVWKDHPPST
jgi:hypothetical protein